MPSVLNERRGFEERDCYPSDHCSDNKITWNEGFGFDLGEMLTL